MNIIMPKPIAKWLLFNTTLTRRQIAEFTGLDEKDIMLIDNGLIEEDLKVLDPRIDGQLSDEEIAESERDPNRPLTNLMSSIIEKYIKPYAREKTYLSKQKNKSKKILSVWIVRNLQNIPDRYISNFFGISKNMIERARNKEFENIIISSPVEMGFCTEDELNIFIKTPELWAKVEKATKRSKTF